MDLLKLVFIFILFTILVHYVSSWDSPKSNVPRVLHMTHIYTPPISTSYSDIVTSFTIDIVNKNMGLLLGYQLQKDSIMVGKVGGFHLF